MGFQQQKHRKKAAHQRNKKRNGPQRQGVSQAALENVPMVTNDPLFRRFMARQAQIQDEAIAG